MYKLLYLPTAEYVIDGTSTYTKPKDLKFDTKQDATYAIETLGIYQISRVIKTNVISGLKQPTNYSDRKRIPKYLIEVVEVKDDI